MGLNIQKTCKKSSQLSTSNSNYRCPLCNSPGKFSFQSRDLLYNKTETYQYMECINCNAVFQYPFPTPTEIREFYPDDYSAYKKLDKPKQHRYSDLSVLHYKYGYTHLHVPWLFRLLASMISAFRQRDVIPFVPNGKALDIGCGNGKFMRTMNSIGWRFEGVEFNPVAVEICRKAGLKVFHGDLKSAGFKDNSFDLISARHIIEHIPDPKNFIGEIARILKNGGRIVIRTPNSQALGRRWFGAKWFANEVPRHLILYNLHNLNMLAERHGLRLIIEKMFTTPKIILNSWDYLIKNRDTPSKKSKICRLIALPYVILATLLHKGDEVFAIYEKS